MLPQRQELQDLREVEPGMAHDRRDDAAAAQEDPPQKAPRSRWRSPRRSPARSGRGRRARCGRATPVTPPPRYCPKRWTMKPRWTSSRTPPAIITTTAKIAASRRFQHVLERIARHVVQLRRVGQDQRQISTTMKNTTGIERDADEHLAQHGARARAARHARFAMRAQEQQHQPDDQRRHRAARRVKTN